MLIYPRELLSTTLRLTISVIQSDLEHLKNLFNLWPMGYPNSNDVMTVEEQWWGVCHDMVDVVG